MSAWSPDDDRRAGRRATRRRLATLTRRADADLAEVAALIAAEARHEDHETEHGAPAPDAVPPILLRVDALADRLRTSGVGGSGDATTDAAALAHAVGGMWGFRGHDRGARDPADGLLDHVLDRRRGLPITLSILYVALGRRVGVRAFPIALPGHVVAGVASDPEAGGRTVVVDPFGGGAPLDEPAITELVRTMTDGQLGFTRSMLRPAPAHLIARRLLNNLTHDFTVRGELAHATWTVECKLVLPDEVPEDHRALGRLLERLGRFDRAATAYQRYVETVGEDESDVDEARRDAVRARARTN